MSVPIFPVGAEGLEGWTSCCGGAVSIGDFGYFCKGCYEDAMPVYLSGEAGRALDGIVRSVISGDVNPDEAIRQQLALIAAEATRA
jgi:hypothetical protein